MALWDWTLEAYARSGVPAATLALQDDHGQNTAYLMWAVWAEVDDPGQLGRAAEIARRWEMLVVAPLRQVRRGLKAAAPPVDNRAREALRDDIKAAELRAERVLMETLETLVGDRRGGASALRALQAASAAWGRPAPDEALAALAIAFEQDHP
jgi:uncharacterized protein (TIGR02444 family)